MSDSEPSHWQTALAVMENIREVQRRADSDSLRYIGLVVAFLVIRASGASSLSILGLHITDTKLIQFALVPIAAFFAIRYAKAQVLTASLSQFLGAHLANHLPSVSPMTCPPNWDILRDMTRRVGRVGALLPGGLELVMYAVIVAGIIVNLNDATDSNRSWALLAILGTIMLFAATLPAMREWKTAVMGRDGI